MPHTLTFQNRVSIGFAVMVALAVITAVVAVYSLRAVVGNKDRVIEVNARNLLDADKLAEATAYTAAGFRGYLLLMENRFLQERDVGRQRFADAFARLQQRVATDEERRLLAEIEKAQNDVILAQDQVISIRASTGRVEPAVRALEQYALPKREVVIQRVKTFGDREQQLLAEGEASSSAAAQLAMTLVSTLGAVAILFAVLTALLLARSLSRQIGSAVQHVQSSSTELQTAATQQATGAREAATALTEVTTTMNELLATSRQIAESAQQVAHIAEQTATAAGSGDQTVARTKEAIELIRRQVDIIVSHMLDLGKKSQQIGGILDIINELAEQTNILSINATIEAAGAGEQGKRFAVVGDEIRRLAERVSGSTKEIRLLVEEIRAAVNTTVLATEGGSKAVDGGLHHFEEVTRGFKQIAGLVETTTQAAREIELSTKQQMTAVEQVNSAMSGAAQAARETEATTAQTAQTASQLAHLSNDLSRIVHPRAA